MENEGNNLADDGFIGRIDNIRSAATKAVDELSIDEHLMGERDLHVVDVEYDGIILNTGRSATAPQIGHDTLDELGEFGRHEDVLVLQRHAHFIFQFFDEAHHVHGAATSAEEIRIVCYIDTEDALPDEADDLLFGHLFF